MPCAVRRNLSFLSVCDGMNLTEVGRPLACSWDTSWCHWLQWCSTCKNRHTTSGGYDFKRSNPEIKVLI